jgi:hypothetical protein
MGTLRAEQFIDRSPSTAAAAVLRRGFAEKGVAFEYVVGAQDDGAARR